MNYKKRPKEEKKQHTYTANQQGNNTFFNIFYMVNIFKKYSINF